MLAIKPGEATTSCALRPDKLKDKLTHRRTINSLARDRFEPPAMIFKNYVTLANGLQSLPNNEVETRFLAVGNGKIGTSSDNACLSIATHYKLGPIYSNFRGLHL
jgi:hypothetical protein